VSSNLTQGGVRIVIALLPFLLGGFDESGLVDPTRPADFNTGIGETDETAEEGHVLSAIFVSQDRRVAVINGQRVQVGDSVAGAEVRAIHNTSVELLVRDKPVVLSLFGGSMKQPPAEER